MSVGSAFMELVQLHERMWGMEQYAGRPSLADLLNAPIVAVWSGDRRRTMETRKPIPVNDVPAERFMLTVHTQVDELDEILLSLILVGKVTPFAGRKLSRLYVRQKPVKVAGVRVIVSDLDLES